MKHLYAKLYGYGLYQGNPWAPKTAAVSGTMVRCFRYLKLLVINLTHLLLSLIHSYLRSWESQKYQWYQVSTHLEHIMSVLKKLLKLEGTKYFGASQYFWGF